MRYTLDRSKTNPIYAYGSGQNMTNQITAIDEPAIWLGCLSCYNNGQLNGRWITAEQAQEPEAAETLNGLATLKTIGDYTASRCRKCAGDEFDVMDHQLIPQSCANAKDFYDNAEELAELHDNDELGIIVSLANHLGADTSLDDLVDYHRDNYRGAYDTVQDFAEQYAEEIGDISAVPEHMRNYIDFEHYGRELMYSHFEEAGHYWASV